jgi:hypothetical protein
MIANATSRPGWLAGVGPLERRVRPQPFDEATSVADEAWKARLGLAHTLFVAGCPNDPMPDDMPALVPVAERLGRSAGLRAQTSLMPT